jgi:hypothetical protein
MGRSEVGRTGIRRTRGSEKKRSRKTKKKWECVRLWKKIWPAFVPESFTGARVAYYCENIGIGLLY